MVTIDIDIKTAMIYLLLAALLVLVCYFIVVAKNLVTTLKNVNKILEDASVVSGVAAEKSLEVNDMIGNVQAAIADVSSAVQGDSSAFGAVANVAKTAASLKNLFKSDKPKKKKKKSINKY